MLCDTRPNWESPRFASQSLPVHSGLAGVGHGMGALLEVPVFLFLKEERKNKRLKKTY